MYRERWWDAVNRPQEFSDLELLAIRKFIFRAAGYGPNDPIPQNYDLNDAVHDATQRIGRIDEQEERIDQLRYTVHQLITDLPTSKQSKRQKMAAIVRKAARDANENADRGTISKPKAAGAADCSDRHALNLFHDLADGFDWARYDPDGKPHARLLIQFGEHGPDAFLERVANEFPEVADS